MEFANFLAIKRHDIVCVSETWLIDSKKMKSYSLMNTTFFDPTEIQTHKEQQHMVER